MIYARKRFYVNKSGYTRNFLKCIKSVNYASKYGISPSLQRTAINDRWTSNIGWDPLLQTKALDSQRYLEARGGMAEWPCQRTRNLISRVDKRINKWVIKGTAVAQRLRCCATNRKVAGSIPAGVVRIFHWHKILPIALWSLSRLSL